MRAVPATLSSVTTAFLTEQMHTATTHDARRNPPVQVLFGHRAVNHFGRGVGDAFVASAVRRRWRRRSSGKYGREGCEECVKDYLLERTGIYSSTT